MQRSFHFGSNLLKKRFVTLCSAVLVRAIKNHGSGDYEPIERIPFIAGWTEFSLNSGFRLDFMTRVKGLENLSFDECYNMAVVAEIEGIPVRFLHYNHLIESKKAANRLKDQLDVEELEKLHTISGKTGHNP